MIKKVIRMAVVIVCLFVLTHPFTVLADELYFIDAHSQVDHTVVPLQTVISVMKQGGVSHTILSARGELQGKTLFELASKYPESITPAVRTKGNPYDKGSPEYYKMLNDHPEHPFILTHMGQLGSVECRRLIEIHKNLHFHTGWNNPAAVKNSDQPWVNLFEGQRLTAEWRDLFTQYPDL